MKNAIAEGNYWMFSGELYDKDHNKNIIVLSATEGRFDNDKLQNSYLHLPNLFELTGLQETDIYISMQNNIENYEEIKNYYRDWYAPRLMAVAVAGDVDSEYVKNLIVEK